MKQLKLLRHKSVKKEGEVSLPTETKQRGVFLRKDVEIRQEVLLQSTNKIKGDINLQNKNEVRREVLLLNEDEIRQKVLLPSMKM